MMTLLRKLFWFALFAAATLGFVTFFDHGYSTTKQFTDDAKTEVGDLHQLWNSVRPATTPGK